MFLSNAMPDTLLYDGGQGNGYADLPDPALIELFIALRDARDRRAEDVFSVIYDRHADHLYRYVLKMIRMRRRRNLPDDARDISQEALIRLARLRPGQVQQDAASLGPYLNTIAINCLNDFYERHPALMHESYEAGIEAGTLTEPTSNADVFQDVCIEKLVEAYEQVLSKLTEKQRTAWLLRMEGFSIREIAAKMGIGEATVKDHLQEAKRKLLSELSRFERGEWL